MVCDIALKISNDYEWKLIANGHPVDGPVIADIPEVLKQDKILVLYNFLSKMVVSKGNTDFPDTLERRIEIKEPLLGLSKERLTLVESSLGKTRLMKSNFDTLRHPECFLVVSKSEICEKCRELQKDFFSIRSKSSIKTQKIIKDSSKVNESCLSTEELQSKLKMAKRKKTESVRRLSYLSMEVSKILNTESIQVSKDLNLELKEIIDNSDNPFHEETPMGLLWQQQKQQAKGKSKAMRWHPLMIRWCLSICHTSPAACRNITGNRNKFLVLPHVNILKKYINYTTPSSGFNKDVIEKIIIDSNLSQSHGYQQNVSLAFDKMIIQSGGTSVCECFKLI